MKKILALTLVLLMTFSMTGCSLVFNLAGKVSEGEAYTEEKETLVEEVESSEEPEVSAEVSEEEPEESTTVGLDHYVFDGMSIFMEKGMSESENENFTVYITGDTAMMAAIKEDKAAFADAGLDISTYTLEDYADIVEKGNGLEESFAVDEAGNLSVTYNSVQNDINFFYYATVKQGTDCFWVINFTCFAESEELYLPQFKTWASTIVCE